MKQFAPILLVLAAAPLGAQTIVSEGQSFVTAELVPGTMTDTGTRMAGLSLTLRPGWKTYWRSPGEAGIPPRLDWSGSTNLREVKVHWPTPSIFDSFGLTTIGYADHVLLPVEITPIDPDQPIGVDLGLDMGVCRDICVFEHAKIEQLLLPGVAAGESRVSAAFAQLPLSGAEAGLSAAICTIAGDGKDQRFDATLSFDQKTSGAEVLIEGPEDIWFHQISTREDGSDLHVSATLTPLLDGAWITRSQIRMTVLAPDWAADIQGCTAAAG